MKGPLQYLDRSKRIVPVSLMLLLVLVLAACQPAVSTTQPAPAIVATSTQASVPVTGATEAATPAAGAEVVVKVVSDPSLGQILVDGNGMTLYAFKKDAPGVSNCSGNCLKSWPPLLSQGSVKAGDGVDAGLLGTVSLPEGSKIVTYNQMPLYFFVKDAKPGDAAGQAVNDVWFVVSPDGKMVESAPSASTGGQPAQPAADFTIKVADDPTFGKILVDGKGLTLYMFKKDEPGKSNCAGNCLKAWPPLLSTDKVTVGDGLDAALLGTAALPDGSKIITYNQMPLYYFAKDAKPGDVAGQGVNSVWYVVSPEGKAIETAPTASTGASSSPVAQGITVKVSTDAKLGQILVDGEGKTLYAYLKDQPDVSNCDAACLKAWPPLVVTGKPAAGDGLDASLLGTTTTTSGATIVTYNHIPLYYWVGDVKPGDTTGQGVGNIWYVVSPAGKTVGADSSTNSDYQTP